MKIGITGGKGGTGKSTVATALAVELAKDNKVLLVDADVDCPNDHLILNIKRKEVKSIFQRIPKFDFNRCTKCGICGTFCKTNAIVSIKGKNPIFMPKQCNGCGACIIKCPANAISWDRKEIGKIYSGEKYKIDFLSGELKVNEPISEIIVNNLRGIAENKKKSYKYIIYDTAAGTHCNVISALEACDIIFAVTEPTPLGAHDLGLILKLADLLKIPKNIVLNRADIGDKELINETARRHKARIVAEIPYKREFLEAYSKGRPIKDKGIDNIKRCLR